MKIFISWSGQQSGAIAGALKGWLPNVIQTADVFLSSTDIEPGTRWMDELGRTLEETAFGLLCITPNNLGSTFLHFEAGALSKSIEQSRVVPLLHGLKPTDLAPPLSHFQGVPLDEGGVLTLLESIANQTDGPPDESQVRSSFEVFWPTLEQELKAVPKELQAAAPPKRSTDELIEEALQLLRDLSRRVSSLEKQDGPGDRVIPELRAAQQGRNYLAHLAQAESPNELLQLVEQTQKENAVLLQELNEKLDEVRAKRARLKGRAPSGDPDSTE